MAGRILPLPDEVRCQLRSGVAIASVAQCVEELVLNSLDAGATCVAVRVDLSIFRIQVVDNGEGVSQADLKYLGRRHATSKCRSIEDLNSNLCHYGFRGEALASITSLSAIVDITTRPQGSPRTLTKLFTFGKERSVSTAKINRPSVGTTVTIQEFMHNMPVRQKLVREAIDVESIRIRLESFALMHTKVAFSLRNDRTNSMVMQTKKSSGILATFLQLYGAERAQGMAEVHHSLGHFTVSGYIGTQPHLTKALQFVYINKRVVLKTKIHRMLNGLLARSSIISARLHPSSVGPSSVGPNKTPSSPPKGMRLYGMFVVNIECPYSEYDICLDPTKTLVEFKDWNQLLICIEELVLQFAHEEGLVISLDERFRKSGKDQEEGEEEEEEKLSLSQSSQSCLQVFSLKRSCEGSKEDEGPGPPKQRYGKTLNTQDNLLAVHSVMVKRSRKEAKVCEEDKEMNCDNDNLDTNKEATEQCNDERESNLDLNQKHEDSRSSVMRNNVRKDYCEDYTEDDVEERHVRIHHKESQGEASRCVEATPVTLQRSPGKRQDNHNSIVPHSFTESEELPASTHTNSKTTHVSESSEGEETVSLATKRREGVRSVLEEFRKVLEEVNGKDKTTESDLDQALTLTENRTQEESGAKDEDGDRTKSNTATLSTLQEFINFHKREQEKDALEGYHTPEGYVRGTPTSPPPLKSRHSLPSPSLEKDTNTLEPCHRITRQSPADPESTRECDFKAEKRKTIEMNPEEHEKRATWASSREHRHGKNSSLSRSLSEKLKNHQNKSKALQSLQRFGYSKTKPSQNIQETYLAARERIVCGGISRVGSNETGSGVGSGVVEPVMCPSINTNLDTTQDQDAVECHDTSFKFEPVITKTFQEVDTCLSHVRSCRENKPSTDVLPAHHSVGDMESRRIEKTNRNPVVDIFSEGGNDGNDVSGNGGNDISGNVGNDINGNVENVIRGNVHNDISGNAWNDISGNDLRGNAGNDISGNDLRGNAGNDLSGNDLRGNAGNDISRNDLSRNVGNDMGDGSDRRLSVLNQPTTTTPKKSSSLVHIAVNYASTPESCDGSPEKPGTPSTPLKVPTFRGFEESSTHPQHITATLPHALDGICTVVNPVQKCVGGEAVNTLARRSQVSDSFIEGDVPRIVNESVTSVETVQQTGGLCDFPSRSNSLYKRTLSICEKDGLTQPVGKEGSQFNVLQNCLDPSAPLYSVAITQSFEVNKAVSQQEGYRDTQEAEEDEQEGVCHFQPSQGFTPSSIEPGMQRLSLNVEDEPRVPVCSQQVHDATNTATAVSVEQDETVQEEIPHQISDPKVLDSASPLSESEKQIRNTLPLPLQMNMESSLVSLCRPPPPEASLAVKTQPLLSSQAGVVTQVEEEESSEPASQTSPNPFSDSLHFSQLTLPDEGNSEATTLNTLPTSCSLSLGPPFTYQSSEHSEPPRKKTSLCDVTFQGKIIQIGNRKGSQEESVEVSRESACEVGTSSSLPGKTHESHNSNTVTLESTKNILTDSLPSVQSVGVTRESSQIFKNPVAYKDPKTSVESSKPEDPVLHKTSNHCQDLKSSTQDISGQTEVITPDMQTPPQGYRWQEAVDKEGRTVYVDLQTGNSSYDPPEVQDGPVWSCSQPLGAKLPKVPITHEPGYIPRGKAQRDRDSFTLSHGFTDLMSWKKTIEMRKRESVGETSSVRNTSHKLGCNSARDGDTMTNPSSVSQEVQEAIESLLQDCEADDDFVKWTEKPESVPQQPAQPSKVAQICQMWEPPDFAMEQEVLNSGPEGGVGPRSGSGVRVYNMIHPYRFSQEMLHSCKVLGQLDEKFIACSLRYQGPDGAPGRPSHLVVLFDQHAVHERVRLETIIQDNCETLDSGETVLSKSAVIPPLELDLPEDEVRLMQAYSEKFNQRGLYFTRASPSRVLFQLIPSCLVAREANEVRQKRCQTAGAIVESVVRDLCYTLHQTGGVLGLIPRPISHVFNTNACRGAIKFGDVLTTKECEDLIASLCSCQLPFQCAHGRPSVVPVVNLTHLASRTTKRTSKPNLRKLREAMDAGVIL